MFCPSKLNDSHNSREKIVPKTFCKTMEKRVRQQRTQSKRLEKLYQASSSPKKGKIRQFFFNADPSP